METMTLEEENRRLKERLAEEQDLNKNLLRIMRERANAQRGIKPKKQHDGYVVLESRQTTATYTADVWAQRADPSLYRSDEKRAYAIKNGLLRSEKKRVEVWKSRLQTPYDASIPFNAICHRIREEMTGTVLESIGIQRVVAPENNGTYAPVANNENVIYNWMYKANYRSGFWEIEIYTTNIITVPADRRPAGRKKKKE